MRILKKTKPYKKIIAAFLLTEILLFALLRWHTQARSDEYLHDMTQRLQTEYHVIIDAFRDKAQIAYATIIDTPQIRSLFYRAQSAALPQQEQLRRELYETLLPAYRRLKRYGFKQLHFHTPDNHSFLRMHAPDKFGDDLSPFRKTVVHVNKTHLPVSGFEEGIANDGYRFVFPLFEPQGYIGSVELSFSTYVLADFLKSEFLDTRFIISKKSIIRQNRNYTPSGIDPDFVTDRRYLENSRVFPPDARFRTHLKQNPAEAFSLDETIEGETYIETFLPIQNSITKSTDAYMIILTDGKYLGHIQKSFWILFGAFSVIIMLLFMRYIKDRNFKARIKEQNQRLSLTNKKLKSILDTQENMIIITDGYKMADVNAKVLQFLGYGSFEQLIRHHSCICDFFIRHDDYFHLGRVPSQQQWVAYLEQLPAQERIVTMVGIDMEAKAFQVNITKFDDRGSSIITMTDVTEMFIRQKILQYKAQHDRLTDIYNRQKIDEVLERICGFSSRRNEQVGIILFDIDHFKSINDNYGHDTGDAVLKAIAGYVKRNIREEDIFGRWGGEEFILILRHTSLQDSYTKAQRLREAIESLQKPDIPHVTASFGVTELMPGDSAESLLKRVDIAMYKAKHEGRNRVVLSAITHSKLVLTTGEED